MKRNAAIIVLLVALAGFGFGLYRLFELRYAAGDVYPEYSSLRADPLGTMALYEALDKMPGLNAERDHSTQNQLPRGRGITYLHLAASSVDWMAMDEELTREIQGFASSGGRLVVTFTPDQNWWSPPPPSTTATTPPSPGKKSGKSNPKDQKKKPAVPSPPSVTTQRNRLGFELKQVPLGSAGQARVEREGDLPLPDELSWHSPLVFTNLDAAWRLIYTRRSDPVVIERQIGLGTIVMATDSYFLSNEALRKDRQPELLAWIVGPARRVLFDEAHLGILEQSGVAILMHKYRLHGFGLALLVLAGLFIWQNATSFPPAVPERSVEAPLAGKESAAGFTNLLRRNIPAARLLRVCFEEWTKSLSHTGSVPIDRVDAAQTVLEADETQAKTSRDPVRTYAQIAAALKGGRR